MLLRRMERNDVANIHRGTHVYGKDKPRRPLLVDDNFRFDRPTYALDITIVRVRLHR